MYVVNSRKLWTSKYSPKKSKNNKAAHFIPKTKNLAELY